MTTLILYKAEALRIPGHTPKMKTLFAFVAILLTANLWADEAAALADAVVKASGGEAWPRVRFIDFTFHVEQNGKQLVSAKHHWDIAKNNDEVSWSGKIVTIDLSAANESGDAKAAFQRWTNDSYWLLAPLKIRDKGTHLEDQGEQTIDGKTYRVLQMSFGSVGLTARDRYNLYIDPATHLVARWDYMPAPDKKVSGTWEGYRDFDGLKLSTEHQFGDKRIYFTDLKVETGN